MTSQIGSPLLKLPRELRDEIYKHVLYSTDVCQHWPSDCSEDDEILRTGVKRTLKHHKAILLTCRQIYQEAFKIFYEVNVFHYNLKPQLSIDISTLRRRYMRIGIGPLSPRRAVTVGHLLPFLIRLDKVAYITHVVLETSVGLPEHLHFFESCIFKPTDPTSRPGSFDFINAYPNKMLGMLHILGSYATSLVKIELKIDKAWCDNVDCLTSTLQAFEEDLPGLINGMFGLKRLGITATGQIGEGGRNVVRSLERCATAIAAQGGWTCLEMWTQHLPPQEPYVDSPHEGKWLMRR